MVGNEKMEEFMHDNIIPKGGLETQKFNVKIEMAIGGTGGPFVAHGANTQPNDFDV